MRDLFICPKTFLNFSRVVGCLSRIFIKKQSRIAICGLSDRFFRASQKHTWVSAMSFSSSSNLGATKLQQTYSMVRLMATCIDRSPTRAITRSHSELALVDVGGVECTRSFHVEWPKRFHFFVLIKEPYLPYWCKNVPVPHAHFPDIYIVYPGLAFCSHRATLLTRMKAISNNATSRTSTIGIVCTVCYQETR